MTVLTLTLLLTTLLVGGFLLVITIFASSKNFLIIFSSKKIPYLFSLFLATGVLVNIALYSYNDFNSNYLSSFTDTESIEIIDISDDVRTLSFRLKYEDRSDLELSIFNRNIEFEKEDFTLSITNKAGEQLYYSNDIDILNDFKDLRTVIVDELTKKKAEGDSIIIKEILHDLFN